MSRVRDGSCRILSYKIKHSYDVKEFLGDYKNLGYEHGFEDLEKRGMFNDKRVHNRVISKQNWMQIVP